MRSTESKTSHVVMVGHNRNDTAFLRRVQMFVDAGASVTAFTFRRDSAAVTLATGWQDIDLGHIEHKRFFSRAVVYGRALLTMFRYRRSLLDSDVVHARNLDVYLLMQLSLALFAPNWLVRGPRNRVYECLDVHFSLTSRSRLSVLLRALERQVLDDADLLITSSAGFVRNYFIPFQYFDKPWLLVENKHPAVELPTSPVSSEMTQSPFIIVWAGTIRCPRTLSLLTEAAALLPDSLKIRICGRVSLFILPDFHERIAGVANIEFRGPYDYPVELNKVYDGAHACWSQDLAQLDGNSGWLIPNRVYEASYYGVPSLAIRGTETAQFVEHNRVGVVLEDDRPETLAAFVKGFDADALAAISRSLIERRHTDFVSNPEDGRRLLANCLAPSSLPA